MAPGVVYQTNCNFKCNITVGYRLEGALEVSCLESGSWSADPNQTTCRGTKCILYFAFTFRCHRMCLNDCLYRGELLLVGGLFFAEVILLQGI